MSVFDDDLTEADMAFLQKFNQLGRSDTADSEYNPEQESEQGEEKGGDAEGSGGDVLVEESDTGGEGESEFPSDDDRRTDIEGEEESDEGEIDDSKMDISNVEAGDPDSTRESSDEAEEKDHLESGDSDSEIQDGESDLEYDDDALYDEHDDELVDDDEAEEEAYEDENADEEITSEEEGSDTESDPDPDMDFDKGGEETHYDEAQVEEDDGEGERANSDDARESDEPIGGGDDSESDPDDKGMTEAEAEEIINEKLDPVQETIDHLNEKREQELNAQEGSDDFEGDAQQELEDHLQNNESEQENEGEGRSQQGQGEGNGDFSDLPSGIPNCDDHCEDNEAADSDDHECPRCAERIMRERKLWGVIATDMNGADIYPGDKVRVEIPMSFFTGGAILTANVPNSQMDRVATKTNGEENPEALWLSGTRISQFTGYNHNGHPVWTFSKGRVLRFAVKVGEPIREGGGQGDIEDMIEELNQDLDNLDQENKDLEENQNQEKDLHEDSEPEEDESDDEEYDEDGKTGPLSKTQMKRFENLFERIEKKVIGTFGGTAEVVEHGEIYTNEDGRIARPVTIKSRGVTYTIVLVAHRG